jgi:hypothetical protein
MPRSLFPLILQELSSRHLLRGALALACARSVRRAINYKKVVLATNR